MKLSIFSAVLVFIASSAMAQHAHQSRSPTETGQSQFAAIAEIVAFLRADPKTDWTQVDIKALHDHLVDMDNVTLKALVERTVDEYRVTFLVTGDTEIAGSIQRMVMAHSPMLQRSSDWSVTVEEQASGAAMIVQVRSVEELYQVMGLGFFGLMTISAHHQWHHLMIATGQSPH